MQRRSQVLNVRCIYLYLKSIIHQFLCSYLGTLADFVIQAQRFPTLPWCHVQAFPAMVAPKCFLVTPATSDKPTEIIIFHQPRFPEIQGHISLSQLPFGGPQVVWGRYNCITQQQNLPTQLRRPENSVPKYLSRLPAWPFRKNRPAIFHDNSILFTTKHINKNLNKDPPNVKIQSINILLPSFSTFRTCS